MTFGKATLKLAPSFSTRKIRLGVAHHGAPSRWSAPTKDAVAVDRGKPNAKKRR